MGEHFERDFKVHSSVITSFSSISVVSENWQINSGKAALDLSDFSFISSQTNVRSEAASKMRKVNLVTIVSTLSFSQAPGSGSDPRVLTCGYINHCEIQSYWFLP